MLKYHNYITSIFPKCNLFWALIAYKYSFYLILMSKPDSFNYCINHTNIDSYLY